MKTASHVVMGWTTLCAAACLAAVGQVDWVRKSSAAGDLTVPNPGNQQTCLVIADFDRDGIDDFAIGERTKTPSVVWYKWNGKGWDRFVIDDARLSPEAGGIACDIDGDGDQDLVLGQDGSGNSIWWWENPLPDFGKPWKRRLIKNSGARKHHDQSVGDCDGDGRPELLSWNQGAGQLLLFEIPADPKGADTWTSTAIYTWESGQELEGFPSRPTDVDGDGKVDIVGGGRWFKHKGGTEYEARVVDDTMRFTQCAAGQLVGGGWAEIVLSPGDMDGEAKWYEYKDGKWLGHSLGHVVHGHTCEVRDINRDSHLDILIGEMGSPGAGDHATIYVWYGNGRGDFRKTVALEGQGIHEGQLGDFDGDGDLDILVKPYHHNAPRVEVLLNNGSRPGARGLGTSASFKGRVGLQLYSLRDTFKNDVTMGLELTRNLGFVEVELAGTYGLAPVEFKRRLESYGLRPIAAHWSYEQWAADPEVAAKEAEQLGLRYAGCAWIPHRGSFDEAACRKAAAVFNRAGEVLGRRGIKFFYHNHGYEFVKYGDGTLFDLLVKETKPELVTFEMDVFWTVHPGQDPVALLRRYPTRWALFHIKDLAKGVPTGKLTGSEDVRNDVTLGTGQIDLPAVLRAAQDIGVRHYFIEDESPSVIEQIPRSVRYLESLSW